MPEYAPLSGLYKLREQVFALTDKIFNLEQHMIKSGDNANSITKTLIDSIDMLKSRLDALDILHDTSSPASIAQRSLVDRVAMLEKTTFQQKTQAPTFFPEQAYINTKFSGDILLVGLLRGNDWCVSIGKRGNDILMSIVDGSEECAIKLTTSDAARLANYLSGVSDHTRY